MRILIAFLLALTLVARADDAPAPLKYLLLPINIRGDYKPVTPEQFSEQIVGQVKEQAPGVEVIAATPEGVDTSYGVPLEHAAALAQQYGVDRIAWISVRFDHGSSLARRGPAPIAVGRPGQDPFRGSYATMDNYVVTVSGSADIQVCDATGKMLIQEPLALTENDTTTTNNGLFGDTETRLALQTSDDLAREIVKAGRSRNAPTTAP